MVTLVGDITARKWRFCERNIIFVRGTSNPHENVYFHEGEKGKNSWKYIFMEVLFEPPWKCLFSWRWKKTFTKIYFHHFMEVLFEPSWKYLFLSRWSQHSHKNYVYFVEALHNSHEMIFMRGEPFSWEGIIALTR